MHAWKPGETITAAKLRSGYASGSATIPFSSSTGRVEITPTTGSGTIYTGSYYRQTVNVTFPAGAFTVAPTVVVTANSSTPGTVMEINVTGITATGFTINGARGNTQDVGVQWVAIDTSN